MTQKFIQPEFILEKIKGKPNERLNTYVVKNIEFNYKPMFVKGGTYSVRECLVESGVIGWISSKYQSALCLDVLNHGRNMIVVLHTLEDLIPAKTSLINRVLVALKIKKPTMIAPPMPQQIVVQLVGIIANEGEKNAKS